MAGKQAKTVATGRRASAAAASPAETQVTDADLTGQPADMDLERELMNQLGGAPVDARSDAAATESEGTDETAGSAQEGAETDESAAGQGGETETPAETAATSESTDNTEGAGADENAETAGSEHAGQAGNDEDLPPGLKRALAELREDRRQLRAQVDNLQRELQSRGGNAAPAAPQTLEAKILAADTPDALAKLRSDWENLEDLALANPNGYQAPSKDGEPAREFTAEDMAQLRTNARRAIRSIGQAEQRLQQTQQFNAAAHQLYPGFNDPASEESRSVQWLLQQVPELKRLPNYKTIIGDALAGERARVKAAQEAVKAKNGKNGQPLPGKPAVGIVRRPPPAVPGAPHRAPSAPPPKATRIAAARDRAEKSGGSEASIAELVEAAL